MEIKNIKRILLELKIETMPFYVDVIPDKDAQINECFHNVRRVVDKQNGSIVFGWKLHEHIFMLEAEFHAVWLTPENQFIDVTPTKNPASLNKMLFAIDANTTYEGRQIDNRRLNKTSNEIVDDFIEVKKAHYRLMNTVAREYLFGKMDLNEDEEVINDGLTESSNILERMLFDNNTIFSECFCESGFSYNDCHRPIIRKTLAII